MTRGKQGIGVHVRSVRPFYALPTAAQLASDVAASSSILASFRQTRELLRDMGDMSESLSQVQKSYSKEISACAAELAQIFDPIILNALELAALYRGESACLLESFLPAAGFRRDMYGRLLVLCAYATCESLREVLGKDFQGAVLTALGPDYHRRARDLHSTVTRLFNTARANAGDVRNELAAHRSPDGSLRSSLLGKFIELDAVTLALELRETLNSLSEIYVIYSNERSLRTKELEQQIAEYIKISA